MVESGLVLHISKTRMRGSQSRKKNEKLCKSHETKQYIELVENDGIQNRDETIFVQCIYYTRIVYNIIQHIYKYVYGKAHQKKT